MKPLVLIISLLISFSAAAIGSLATLPNISTWYALLDKPFFNPPNWIFGPVWTLLYILIGISLYLVWIQKTNRSKKSAFVTFGVQLVLNALWSIVFFGLHAPWAAFTVIVALLGVIIFTMLAFYRISHAATYLLIPYAAWVIFAAFLNLAIGIMN